MVKVSEKIRGLIGAPFARPNPIPAPLGILDVYSRLIGEAKERRYGERSVIALSVSVANY